MVGRAAAPAAGTVLNALANGYGSAFAIDAYTEATVELDGSGSVTGEIDGAPDADTRLIKRCVESVTERFGDGEGGHVRTESEVPMASGLKSSSAAANATVLATLDALDVDLDREEACRIGVDAARDVGVTVTGAFDDASASMLGGVTVTDNTEDELLDREEPEWDVLVYTPDERGFSADADVSRCERIAPMADVAYELAVEGEYRRAMCVNGFAFCAALDRSAEPIVEALPDAAASLSGTGPSYTAVGDRDALEALSEVWSQRKGKTWLTTTQRTGATSR
ncbi:shikimate kinase [Natronomonas sp. LN261]|jgi:shikimate kinase|uniref:shikimate kinase n=1 Tax=Natronomonas sp. LN261 TaxID=2750669 RepID=UPI0015EEAD73|nr:shikimate kinase [Natronomonas sp. LN261]